MITEKMVEELERLSRLVDLGKFSCALNDLYVLLELVESSTDKSSTDKNGAYYRMLSNIAGVFIDIGHMQPNTEVSNKGLQILEHNEAKIMEQTEEKDVYYYNLSNAKSNLIAEKKKWTPMLGQFFGFLKCIPTIFKPLLVIHEADHSKPDLA